MKRLSLGAIPQKGGTHFKLWAPTAKSIDVVVGDRFHPLHRSKNGYWIGNFSDVRAGALYRFRINGGISFPDPASRFQPSGVHGPSAVTDLSSFRWSDQHWQGIPMQHLILYELHIGTFTPEGTFAAAMERLPYLVDLGITALELMPIADFPGQRNWGYDGADLFAPARCYGTPQDLQRLVDAAHRNGLAVLLDVVYNHLGPDGAYAGVFSPYFFSQQHKTPWGNAINLDGKHSAGVRKFLLENAIYWLSEFHFDGLRLDAIHALIDDSPQHFLAELSSQVRKLFPGKRPILIAEDHRNLAYLVKPEGQGGWGLDGVWSDDFHHELRRLLAGDREGYYQDYTGSTQDLATIVNQGWIFTGQHSEYFRIARGDDPSGLPPPKFVFFLQNHDQVGNRAKGKRLNHHIELPAYRAASTFFLCLPQTPLLFQGQEWAASSPFCYFTDHNEELGRLVTQGRRRELKRFSAFSDPNTWQNIPAPQSIDTFQRSRLDWPEVEKDQHASTLRLYKALLQFRKTEPVFKSAGSFQAQAPDESTIILKRDILKATVLVIARLKDGGNVRLNGYSGKWDTILTTEDAAFCNDPQPPLIDFSAGEPTIHFLRPGALILRRSS